jgi:hypothetical protein
MPGEGEATTAAHSAGVKLLSLAAVGVKQTGRNHSSSQLQPDIDSLISPIPAGINTQTSAAQVVRPAVMVKTSEGELLETDNASGSVSGGRSARQGVKRKKSTGQRRRRRRRARDRQLVQAATAVINAATVQHDSCELMVVSAVVDGKHCYDVLIDPGSSSNFVRRDWAIASGLTLQPLAKVLQVTLADNKVAARLDAAVSVTSLEVQGSKAPCTLTVMDHLSHKIIIGLPWLRKAGVQLGCDEIMTWNGRRMYPVMLGSRHDGAQLQGLEVAPEHEARMGKLLQRFPAAFSNELRKKSPARCCFCEHCRDKSNLPPAHIMCSVYECFLF